MHYGWLGEHAPSAAAVAQLRRRLKAAGGRTESVEPFVADIARLIAVYRSRVEPQSAAGERRSAMRYLLALKEGRKPRAVLPTRYAELLHSHAFGYHGDERRAAGAILRALEQKQGGRPRDALTDWLIAQTAVAFRRHFGATASIHKNSSFARHTLHTVALAAGLRNVRNLGERIAPALALWESA